MTTDEYIYHRLRTIRRVAGTKPTGLTLSEGYSQFTLDNWALVYHSTWYDGVVLQNSLLLDFLFMGKAVRTISH